MFFSSWFRRFGQRSNRKPIQTRLPKRSFAQLAVERLEARELLAGVPVVTAVTPLDGSSITQTSPAIAVTFNEDVKGANVAANFSLFDSTGAAVPISAAVYTKPAGGPFVSTLTYNAGKPLDSGTYTLFVRGDQIIDATAGSTLAMALPGQVVVVNSGKNNVATMSMPGTGTLGTLSNLALPPSGTTQSKPSAIAMADLTGDTIPDMIVLDAATSSVDIYAGHTGGVFNLAPDLVLALPAGAGATALATADFNIDTNADIVVANTALGTVSVFLNARVNVGDLTFSAPTNYAAGTSPNGIAIADFNADNNPDLAISNGTADSTGSFNVTILPGSAGGTFGAAVTIAVGASGSTGLATPTGIAAGLLDADAKPDLAVSGSGGVALLTNTTTGSAINFSTAMLATSSSTAVTFDTTSITTGVLRSTAVANPRADIVATTNSNNGQIIILVNDNTGVFTPLPGVAAGGTPTAVTINDLDGDGLKDILVTNNIAAGQVTVLRNTSRSGLISATSANGSTPVVVTSNGHGLSNGATVVISGALGNTAINGVFPISGVTTNTFNLAGVTANGAYTGGGSWSAVTFNNGTGAITGASNASPIVITSTAHSLVTGQRVTVAGVVGNTGANGTFFVKVVDANTFQLLGSTGNGAFSATGTPTWTRAPYSVDPNPVGLALADTNQDGKLDLVTANSVGRDVSVLRGNGDTSFLLSNNLAVTPATQPDAVAVGDLNGDGLPDLVVADAGTNQVSVFLALAAGGYGPPTAVSTLSAGLGSTPVSVALADLTGTGKLDIITASQQNNVVTILANNGAGVFSVFGTAATGQTPVKVVTGDFNGDGKADLAVAHSSGGGGFGGKGGGGGGGGGGVTMLLGNGNRTFQTATEVSLNTGGGGGFGGKGGGPGQGAVPSSVVAGDFNKDGILDLVVANNSAPGSVFLLLGDGTGAFVNANSFAVGNNPVAIVAADFNDDGFLDVVTVSKSATSASNISVLLNAAGGGFSPFISTTVSNGVGIQDVAVANVNQDPFPDLIVTASPGVITGATNAGPIVITSANHGLNTGAQIMISGVGGNTAANGIWTITVLTANTFSLNGSTGNAAYTSGGVWSQTPAAAINNVFTLLGVGNGTFLSPLPYQAGGAGAPSPIPSYVAVVSDAFRRVSTFTVVGTTVNANLVRNGDFEKLDLSGEQGNLNGWQTFDLSGSPGSRGRWGSQTGTTSPLSLTTVTPPSQGIFQAMLDEEDQSPFVRTQGMGPGMGQTGGTMSNIPGSTNSNGPEIYAGSHALYQDITIPASATQITLSYSLFINDTGATTGYSDTTSNTQLNFNTVADNQQVRVDLVNTNALPLATVADNPLTSTFGVLQNLFITAPGQAATQTLTPTFTLDPLVYAGKTIRLRFAATNNRGKLLVGVDNVKVQVRFSDTDNPTFTGLRIRNPSSLASPTLPDPTTDPTIVGTVGDNGSINNLNFIEIDAKNDGFGQLDDVKLTNWDANGNFNFAVPTSALVTGLNTVTIRAVDKAGNQIVSSINFVMQGASDVVWSPQGPDAINVSSTGVGYSTVSGDITAIALDPRDATGNTYYIAAGNGGVWKTTDGGADWKVLTDNVKDSNGQLVQPTIGALAMGVATSTTAGQPPSVLYAAAGIADNSLSSNPGSGVLVSVDNGLTWTLVGQSVLGGARVSKVLVDPTNINIFYVAVSSFADTTKRPGVFRGVRSSNGTVTLTNILNPALMYFPGRTTTLGANATLASVTDLVMDPFNNKRLLVGLGNIGQVAASASAGVWLSTDSGATWDQVVGGTAANVPNNTLPSGTTVGRVTIGIGGGRLGDERYVYVLMGNPPPATPVTNTFDQGTMLGLFRTKDNMLNFTKVMLKQNQGGKGSENFVDLNLLGRDASDVGALAVDINNPNVVYVGGSRQFLQASDPTAHGVVRVDTGNMRDTTYTVGGGIPNDGDDITKAFIAANPPAPTTTGPNRDVNHYDTSPSGALYKGEGVYWYDLEEASTGTTGSSRLLPNAIHALAFDSQGRLLIGTESGLWRGIGYGFSYDFTSGGSGIATDLGGLGMGGMGGQGGGPGGILGGGGTGNSTQGMKLTALNGNLQITELTSVAVDPAGASTLYASQYASGTSLTVSGPLGWVSGGTTGPSDALLGNLGVTTATVVRVAAPDPNAPAGTPSTIFRVWQASTPNAVFPEISTDGGNTFSPVASAGINTNDAAALSPGFAINPNKVVVNGLAVDELLFGTQRVYLTRTSTNVWDVISPVLTQTGFITALAFAPSNPGVYYAGTTNGMVFVQTPGANWPNSSTGLPGIPGSATAPRINNIMVDPTNGAVAFALLDGSGFAHVFKTIDGGAHWSPSNGLVGGGKLPDVPAYSMAIDPRPAFGAPFGRYYLGTATGVYVSLDKGATWLKFGQGLPAVPVVDLQFDASEELLVAAAQGRGVFEISTRTGGPQVTDISPSTPVNQALTQVTVTFNESVDVRSFTTNANAAARVSVANSLLFTDSYRTNRVNQLFQQYLRSAPTGSIQGQVTLLQQQGEEAVVSGLISSDTYFLNPSLGNNTNSTWINQIYLDLLHRSATGDAGATNMLTALNAKQVTRAQIANALVASTEFRGDEVAALYNQILARNKLIPASPTDPEIAPWLPLLVNGGRIESLMANLLGSQEYYLNNDGQIATGAGSQPVVTALANLSGNKDSNNTPILDLLVANKNNTISIYQGHVGGGYSQPVTLTLTLPANAAPRAITIGDFNNDSKPDVAVANSGTDNVTVYLNTSTGGVISFANNAGTNFSVGAGSGPVAIVAAKINADANIDLAVVSSKAVSNNFNLYILIGSTTGSFGTLTTVSSGMTVPLTGVAAGDVNSDNLTDFAISASDGGGTGGVRLLRATGTLAYTGSTLTTTATTSVALAKIDTNASLDIVATAAAGNTVLVLQNQGGSPVVFAAAPLSFAAGASPSGVAVADLNGDGHNDIVVFNNVAAGTVTALLGTTKTASSGFDTITFGNAVSYPVQGGKPVAMALGDINQDLVPDAVLAIQGNDSVFVLPGTSQGAFVMPTDELFVTSIYKRLTGATPNLASLTSNVQTLGQGEQSRLSGPNGSTVPVSIVETDTATHRTFQLTFAPQTLEGSYTLTLGPNTLGNNIKDFVDISGTYQNNGLPLNQNNNTVSGEFPADRFTGKLAINTSDDGRFVTGMYHDLLGADPSGRAADTAGFLNALAPVDAAQFAVLASFAPAFTTSPEYRRGLVQSYYSKYLRRTSATLPAVNSTEVLNWVSYLDTATLTEEGIIAQFLSGPEYFAVAGGSTPATWLAAVYNDLLGHGTATDPNAGPYLASLTPDPATRAAVVNKLITSDEYLRRVIFTDYSNLVGRAPHDNADPAQSEFLALLPILKQTTFVKGGPSPDEQLIDALLGSHEYFQHVGNTDRLWAASIYTRVLGRTGIDPDKSTEVNNLLAGPGGILDAYSATRQTAAANLLATVEYKNRLVAGYYQGHLGRAATTVEINAWVSQMPPITDDQVLANIVSSAEYYPLTGSGSSNGGWLDKLYNDLLKRSYNSAANNGQGEGFFLFTLDHTAPAQIVQARITTALSVLQSAEYRYILVATFFNKYLGKNKLLSAAFNDPELTPYVNLLNAGASQEQIIAILIGLKDYALLTHAFP